MSPAAVVMFAAPGKISEVALCVKVSTPANTSRRRAPAAIVSNPVIVVVPVIEIVFPAAAPIAPDAPRVGIDDMGDTQMWVDEATIPQKK